MCRAQLGLLHGKPQIRTTLERDANTVGHMANDDDRRAGPERRCGAKHVLDQRASCDAMEHLLDARPHPNASACRQDDQMGGGHASPPV